MKYFLKEIIKYIKKRYLRLGIFVVMTLSNTFALADIPAAPNVAGGNGSDYIKTGQSVADEMLGIGITILYVGAILAYCAGLLWLLGQAKKTKDWGNFFKGAGIGLGVLVLVLILLNQAKTALGIG